MAQTDLTMTAAGPAIDSWTPNVTTIYDNTWFHACRTGTRIVHLIPWKDLRPHRTGLDCECRPQQVSPLVGPDGVSTPFIVHQSWDAREYFAGQRAERRQRPSAVDPAEADETDDDSEDDDYVDENEDDDEDYDFSADYLDDSGDDDESAEF